MKKITPPLELEKYLNAAIAHARAMIEEGKTYHPMLICGQVGIPHQQVCAFPEMMETDETKRRGKTAIATFCKAARADYLIFAAESYFLQVPLDSPLPQSVANHPDKKEIITFFVESFNHGNYLALCKIKRTPSVNFLCNPSYLELNEKTAGGRLYPLLPKQEAHS